MCPRGRAWKFAHKKQHIFGGWGLIWYGFLRPVYHYNLVSLVNVEEGTKMPSPISCIQLPCSHHWERTTYKSSVNPVAWISSWLVKVIFLLLAGSEDHTYIQWEKMTKVWKQKHLHLRILCHLQSLKAAVIKNPMWNLRLFWHGFGRGRVFDFVSVISLTKAIEQSWMSCKWGAYFSSGYHSDRLVLLWMVGKFQG